MKKLKLFLLVISALVLGISVQAKAQAEITSEERVQLAQICEKIEKFAYTQDFLANGRVLTHFNTSLTLEEGLFVINLVEREFSAETSPKIETVKLFEEEKLTVVGDLHGDLPRAVRAVYELERAHAKGVFLGDYVDRGCHSMETIVYLLAKKCLLSKGQLTLLRGNHEVENMNMYNEDTTLFTEVLRKFGEGEQVNQFLATTNRLFDCFPFVAMIQNRKGEDLYFCSHGGYSESMIQQEIRKLHSLSLTSSVSWEMIKEAEGEDFREILWSDFNKDLRSHSFDCLFEVNERREGFCKCYSPRAIHEFCKKNGGLLGTFHGHSHPVNGVEMSPAANARGEKVNEICIALCSSLMVCSYPSMLWISGEEVEKIDVCDILPLHHLARARLSKKR